MPRDGQLDQLVADLSKLPRAVRRELQPALERAARPIERDLKRRASWSSRIPDAVSVDASAGGRLFGRAPGVRLRVDARKAPHARPLEGMTGRLRHPVFGNREAWVGQPVRPFFAPAIVAGQAGVTRAVDEAVQAAARTAGFR